MPDISPALQPQQPTQPNFSPQKVAHPFKDGEVNQEFGKQLAQKVKAEAGINSESKTFTITWPADMGSTWMTSNNLKQIIENCCPGAKFEVTE